MFNTDKVMEMLPYAVNMIEKIGLKAFILENKEIIDMKNKAKAIERMNDKGFDFLMYILKNAYKAKEDIYNCLAIARGVSTDEIRSQAFTATLTQLKELLEEEDLIAFFGNAV